MTDHRTGIGAREHGSGTAKGAPAGVMAAGALAAPAAEAAQTMRRNQLMSTALDAVREGRLEAAQALIDGQQSAPLTLDEVFRLYQNELQTQQEQLRDSQLRTERMLDWFANLFRTLPVAALLVDRSGMIIDANALALDELDLRDALRVLPVPLRRLTATPQDELRLAALLPGLAEGQSGGVDDLGLRTLKGRLRWADLRITQVPARDGEVAGPLALCVLNDRTARVEAQRAREAAELAAHERDIALSASQAKSQMLARVSHELRTPLNAVLGFSQLLLMRGEPMSDAARRQITLIQEAGRHLLSLVDEVLQINRAEAGQMVLEIAPVSLRKKAQVVLALQQPAADAMHLAITGPDDSGETAEVLARGDARRVREVLTNLVSNAIKYNRPGGWVRLEIGHDSAHVWLAVSDSGIGMTPQQLEHLFEPFNRLGADRLHVVGHGLGLSIARTLAQAMGGSLLVSSVPGQGSRFVLRLPRWDSMPPPVHIPAALADALPAELPRSPAA